MQEAWLQLQCPACSATWEAQVSDLSAPDTQFICDDCGNERSLSEFMRTARDLEVLQEFTDA
jgi:transposase-like protein